jgi:cellulose synthase/poly-beta-1,6-N-acetylglucosamine synthase-like glycosyltransferase
VRLVKVSVVMPCRDEERHIAVAIGSLLGGSFPADEMELLVVDGRSRDATRDIVAHIMERDPRVRLVDNPRRTTPAALNLGIRAAAGEIIVRVDAHTEYPRDYVAVLVRTLAETGADLVGCGEVAVATERGPIARTIALALGGAFGTGSPYRYRHSSGPVDTVSFGCWRRELFDRVGLFDERLLRNQDYEHARRIRRAGGRAWLTTETCIRYFPRPTLRKLWQQAAQTGMWNAFMQRLCPYTFAWRHVLPGLFFLGVLLAGLLITAGAWSAHALYWRLGVGLLAPYAAVAVLASAWQARQRGAPELAPLAAFVVASHHFTYGYGICKGWLLIAAGRWRQRLGAP